MIYKILHIKLKTEQIRIHYKPGMNSDFSEVSAVLAPLEAPVM
jgi:hypothetical protein